MGSESFLESNSTDIIASFEINLQDSINSSSFSVLGFCPLIRKGFVTHMLDCEVCP